jgi:hypothetical protein
MPRDRTDAGQALENASAASPPSGPARAPAATAAAAPGTPDSPLAPSVEDFHKARTAPIPQQVQAVPLEIAAPNMARRRRIDETAPGGRYIQGGRLDEETGEHKGGMVVDAEGKVLATFEADQVNDGNPDSGKKPETQ